MAKEIEIKHSRLGMNPMKYDSVVENNNTKGFTAVGLQTYIHTTGVRMRVLKRSGGSQLIGYCVEPPAEVLKKLFHKYHVTQFNYQSFFASHDFKESTPMQGLSISGIPETRGIKGTLTELMEAPEFEAVKRVHPFIAEDKERVRAHIVGDDYLGDFDPRVTQRLINPDMDQIEFDKKEILAIIGVPYNS